MQSFPNKNGILITPHFNIHQGYSAINSMTMNAAGESNTIIGQVVLEGGSGSKTISSAGGKIHWRANTPIVFANAATNLRIGIQDVAATGLEDTTFDVYADLVGGTDIITASSLISTAMETGTKTISHGDRVAIAMEMTTRGGTDSVLAAVTPTGQFVYPYGTRDTATLAKSAQALLATIEFDDGTAGWIHPLYVLPGSTVYGVAQTFNSGSTPDERALIFQLPFKATISGIYAILGSVASTDDFEAILYSNPLGTPVAESTITIDADYTDSAGSQTIFVGNLGSGYTLSANTLYAVAIRPTTANSIQTHDYAFGSTVLMKPTTLGSNWYLGTRSNQTGAFSTTTTTIPHIGLWLSQFDDGEGGGAVWIG
jgi:hypothetical protein